MGISSLGTESDIVGSLMQLDFRDPAEKNMCHSVKDLQTNERRGIGDYHLVRYQSSLIKVKKLCSVKSTKLIIRILQYLCKPNRLITVLLGDN